MLPFDADRFANPMKCAKCTKEDYPNVSYHLPRWNYDLHTGRGDFLELSCRRCGASVNMMTAEPEDAKP